MLLALNKGKNKVGCSSIRFCTQIENLTLKDCRRATSNTLSKAENVKRQSYVMIQIVSAHCALVGCLLVTRKRGKGCDLRLTPRSKPTMCAPRPSPSFYLVLSEYAEKLLIHTYGHCTLHTRVPKHGLVMSASLFHLELSWVGRMGETQYGCSWHHALCHSWHVLTVEAWYGTEILVHHCLRRIQGAENNETGYPNADPWLPYTPFTLCQPTLAAQQWGRLD